MHYEDFEHSRYITAEFDMLLNMEWDSDYTFITEKPINAHHTCPSRVENIFLCQ